MIDGTCVEWLALRKSRSDNTSGFRGVYRGKNGQYFAQIGFKGQRFYIGKYDTFEEAVQGRLEVEELIHGGFLRAYHAWNQKAQTDEVWAGEHPFVFEVKKEHGVFHIITE